MKNFSERLANLYKAFSIEPEKKDFKKEELPVAEATASKETANDVKEHVEEVPTIDKESNEVKTEA